MHDSAWGRTVGVLVSPTRTFQSIAERPTWVVPLIVLLLIGSLAITVVTYKVDMDTAIRDAMERQGQVVDDAQIEQIAGVQRGIGLGCGLFFQVASFFLIALLLMAGVSLLGGGMPYPASLATAVHALMPWAIANLLIAAVAWSAGSLDAQQVQAGNVLAASPAAFLPESASPVVTAFLTSFNVFSFWTVGLLVVGVSIVGKLSRGKAVGLVLTLWALYIGFKVGMVALGSAFGG